MSVQDFVHEVYHAAAFSPLFRNNQRLFGADNTGGWHLHPFHDPQQHIPLSSPLSFAEFLRMLEQQVSSESPRP